MEEKIFSDCRLWIKTPVVTSVRVIPFEVLSSIQSHVIHPIHMSNLSPVLLLVQTPLRDVCPWSLRITTVLVCVCSYPIISLYLEYLCYKEWHYHSVALTEDQALPRWSHSPPIPHTTTIINWLCHTILPMSIGICWDPMAHFCDNSYMANLNMSNNSRKPITPLKTM